MSKTIPNHVYDYLKKWDSWSPKDHHSQLKFAQDVAKEFDVTLAEAERMINDYRASLNEEV